MANKKFERELTGKEHAKTFAILFVGILLVGYGEGMPFEYATSTLCINALGLIIAGIALLYQSHMMHTPLEDKNKKEEEQSDGE
jgi:hypothetical protein